jgi:hypothetical protein
VEEREVKTTAVEGEKREEGETEEVTEKVEEAEARRRGKELYIRVDTKRTSRLVIDFSKRKRTLVEIPQAEECDVKKKGEEVERAPPIPMLPMSHVLSGTPSTLSGFTALDSSDQVESSTFMDTSVSESRYVSSESFLGKVIRAAQKFSYRSLL